MPRLNSPCGVPWLGSSCSKANPNLSSSDPSYRLLDCGVSGNVVTMSDWVEDSSAMPTTATPLCAEMNGCSARLPAVGLV